MKRHARWKLVGLVLLLGACEKSGPSTGNGPTGLPSVPGEPDTSVQTALPELPQLPSVTATTIGGSVSIRFEPVDGARDYRVYVLPNDSAVSSEADGFVTVTNATYRCAGDRQTPRVSKDKEPLQQSEGILTIVEGKPIDGVTRTLADATLGYVYLKPGTGRVPVYAMGDPSPGGDNACYHQRWKESRAKRYVTSETERTQLLAERWRDDGIVFYVPAAADATTKPVYASGMDKPLYYVDGAEATERGTDTTAFLALAAAPTPASAEIVPLLRVHYENSCGKSHDELVAGKPRFDRARNQGDQLPLFELHWSGITAQTTLVVEALDVGCPYQGMLSPYSRPASREDGIDYPAFVTLDELHASMPRGEVFINGQHAANNRPRPIARSFLKVAPGPKPDLDWFMGFGADEGFPDFATAAFDTPCDNPDSPTCWGEHRQSTAMVDVHYRSAVESRDVIGRVLDELWILYADIGADVGGKIRITPNQKATMSSGEYLHVTMEVDAFTTTRRYPQILVSEGAAPVDVNLAKSNTIIVQPFADQGTANWPYLLQLQLCRHRTWDVNNQCPATDLYRLGSSDDPTGLLPVPELGELTGVDRSTRFDAFLSPERAYLFADGQPYGCVDLPSDGAPRGEVTVTFGDVLYHSGVDAVFRFHEDHQLVVAKRHFDNLGWKSGAPAPAWDESRMPCFPASSID